MTTSENMFFKFSRLFRKIFLAAGIITVCAVRPAAAEEISAIDFNGDLIGKVIPNGSVVGLDNQLIGNVTADSLIVNSDGKLIGGEESDFFQRLQSLGDQLTGVMGGFR